MLLNDTRNTVAIKLESCAHTKTEWFRRVLLTQKTHARPKLKQNNNLAHGETVTPY